MNTIELKDLTKKRGDFTLDRITFTLPGGCILGLIGENGAGKSTTIKLMLGLLQKDGGTVSILGRENGERDTLLKEEIGVVMDEVGLPGCLTPAQTGKMMSKIYRSWEPERYKELIRKFALPWDKPFQEFSKGMKMKQGLAVALSHKSKLLILDEATSGLDPVARDELLDILREFVTDEEHGILISSHIVSDLEKLCDYIAFLHKGRLLLWEEKDRLLEEYGIFRGSRSQLETLAPEAVCHKRVTPYGTEALVLRERLPRGTEVSPVSIEELFVQLVKEEKAE